MTQAIPSPVFPHPAPAPSILIAEACNRMSQSVAIVQQPQGKAWKILDQLREVLDRPMEWTPDEGEGVGVPRTFTAQEVIAFMKRPGCVQAVENLGRGHESRRLIGKSLLPNFPARDAFVLAIIKIIAPWAEALDPPSVKRDIQERWWWRQCVSALENDATETTVAVLDHFRGPILSANAAVCRRVASLAYERRKKGETPKDIEVWLTTLCDAGLVQPKAMKSILLRSAANVGGVAQALADRSTPNAQGSQAICNLLMRWGALNKVNYGRWSSQTAERWVGERVDIEQAIDILMPRSSLPNMFHTIRQNPHALKQVMGALARYAPQVAEEYLSTELIMTPGLADDPELARLILRQHVGLNIPELTPKNRRRAI